MTRSIRRTATWLAVLAFAPAAAPASGVARRVADLRTQPSAPWYAGSFQFGRVGPHALLSFDRPGLGTELWRSDGTPAGTVLLRNIAAGSDAAEPILFGEVAGGRTLFSAQTLERGRELWVTDGTAAGTALLRDFTPGIASTEMKPIGWLGGALLLAVAHQPGSLEIWRSDGTDAGTTLVRKVQRPPGPVSLTYGEADSALYDGELYFAMTDATSGSELWASDGTDGGTRRVADLRPGTESSAPFRFVADGVRLGFTSFLGAPNWGEEAWVLDATSPLPRPIPLPIARKSARVVGRVPGGLIVYARGGGTGRLWFSDGTPAGAIELRELGSPFLDDFEPEQVGDRVVFSETTPAQGTELWVTDGSPAGTTLLLDLVPGSGRSYPSQLVGGHDGSYFCEGVSDAFWRTDGTTAGTVEVATTPSPCEFLLGAAALPGVTLMDFCWTVYVPPHDEEIRCEAYRTDGTAAGTLRLLAPIQLSASAPQSLTARTGGLVFAARPDGPPSPYFDLHGFATDGTEAGTVELTLAGGQTVAVTGEFERLSDGSILIGDLEDDTTGHLSRVDGSDLVPLLTLPDGWIDSLEAAGDLAYFPLWLSSTGTELWASDGTAAGTDLVRDLEPGEEGGAPWGLTDIFGEAAFLATTSAHGTELWLSDGTPAGTRPVDIVPGPDSTFENPWLPAPFREDPARIAIESSAGLHLVDLDAGEQILLQPATGWGGFGVVTLGSGDGARLLYWAYDEVEGCILRSSDGTPEDVVRLPNMAPDGDIASLPGFGCDGGFAVAGSLGYYVSCDLATGCELWSTDGTLAGTQRFADFEPGPTSSIPRELSAIGDRLYFALCRQATGCEPWISDFTPAGTHPLGDISPGPVSSDPRGFTRSDPYVYFAADDGTGSELWLVPIEIFYDGFQTGDTSRWSAAPQARSSRSVPDPCRR
jgi:ELWxxDGT repeat protein